MRRNKPWVIIVSLLVFSLCLETLACAQNLLKNGSFEEGLNKKNIPRYWGEEYYNSFPGRGGPKGASFLRIVNTEPKMSLGAQVVPLDGRKVRFVDISAYIKLINVVPGPEPWMKANIQPLFLDAKGEQVGGWPQFGPWGGDMDWSQVKRRFAVPPATRSLKIVFGLFNASGEADFDDLQVTLPTVKEDDPYNLVSNGGFEVWEDWAYGGSEGMETPCPGYKGGSMLKIHNPTGVWSFASQSIALDGSKAKNLKVSAYIKIQDVEQGPMPWQQARVNIEFKDANGERIGGWPIVGSFTGSFDWKKIEKEFSVPPTTKRVDLFAGLMEVPGTLWVDEIRVEAFDKNNKPIKKQGNFVTNTAGWHAFRAPKENKGNTATDVSFLLDPPAGKHGFMSSQDGKFFFEDGTRARFWGVNLYAPDVFMDHQKAEKLAERLARYGCNLVRLHHLDAYWANPNIFDPKYNDTLHLSEKRLEQLDYLISQLKKRGIYVFLDLLVDRQFKEGDNVTDWRRVERGAKFTGFFNRRIIDLQKDYAQQMLLHYNPYTKTRYVDEPAIVSYKLINESMLFYISTVFDLSPFYLKELDDLWNQWLVKKYGNREVLRAAWTDKYGRCDLSDGEDPMQSSVKRGDTLLKFQRGGFEKVENLRNFDTMLFYGQVQENYYQEMSAYLKSLGCRVPVSGSNHWVNIAADVKTNASLDYIDRHRYWDHPKYGYGTSIVFEDLPMVKYPEAALPNNFAFYRVADRPFVVSEWNSCFPNEYRMEGPLIMAAYSLLQDWDGVLQFSYNNKEWGSLVQDNFDISSWPNTFSLWPAAALLFHRGDVATAKTVLEETLGPAQTYGPIFEDDPIAGEPLLPLISRTQLRFASSLENKKPIDPDLLMEEFADKEGKVVSSDTKELLWDWGKGLFSINTERTQAWVGLLGGKSLSLPNLVVSAKTPFAVISLSSLGEVPIGTSKRLLLTATAREENSGQKYNPVKTQLKVVGTGPLLVEGVAASVSILLNEKPKSAQVFSLDMNGNRLTAIAVQIKGKALSFSIKPADRAMFYEVVLK